MFEMRNVMVWIFYNLKNKLLGVKVTDFSIQMIVLNNKVVFIFNF